MRIVSDYFDNINPYKRESGYRNISRSMTGEFQPNIKLSYVIRVEPFQVLSLVREDNHGKLMIHSTYFNDDLKSISYSHIINGLKEFTFSAQFDEGRVLTYEDSNGDYFDSKIMSCDCPFLNQNKLFHWTEVHYREVENLFRHKYEPHKIYRDKDSFYPEFPNNNFI